MIYFSTIDPVVVYLRSVVNHPSHFSFNAFIMVNVSHRKCCHIMDIFRLVVPTVQRQIGFDDDYFIFNVIIFYIKIRHIKIFMKNKGLMFVGSF
jgi:hypothetical protein